jgi:molybdopterin/thiamine biosynthesis adenylyltransferase
MKTKKGRPRIRIPWWFPWFLWFLLSKDRVYELSPNPFRKWLYKLRTDRNKPWITEEEQQHLKKKRKMGFAGFGGIGPRIAEAFHRGGIGEIRIADNDMFDFSNLNRQLVAFISTMGKSKIITAAKLFRDIADDTIIVLYPMGINEDSVEDFVEGLDDVCDEIEFWCVGSRILLHEACRKAGVPNIWNCPTVGHRTYIYWFTKDSPHIEDILGMTREKGMYLESLQPHMLSPEERQQIAEPMLAFMAPVVPEYSADPLVCSIRKAVIDRLLNDGKAPIIFTNPPVAGGLVATKILLQILDEAGFVKRKVSLVHSFPGRWMFDAATDELENLEAA